MEYLSISQMAEKWGVSRRRIQVLCWERKNQTEVALQIIDDRIAETSAQIEEARKKLEKAKVDYTSKGGDIVVQRQDLFTERTALVAKVEQGY